VAQHLDVDAVRADPGRAAAEELAAQLSLKGIPSLTIDTALLPQIRPLYPVTRFVLGESTLQVEGAGEKPLEIEFAKFELLILATCRSDQLQTTKTATKRKFSMGKTLLAGGIPMTKKVKQTMISATEDHDKTLWLYSNHREIPCFNCNKLNYSGLGSARQLTRELNFKSLQQELLRLASHADCDERLLNRATQIKILGQSLNPDIYLNLAFEVLYQTHKRIKDDQVQDEY
jgi:hypothetical protein